jgi:hypothetical protein
MVTSLLKNFRSRIIYHRLFAFIDYTSLNANLKLFENKFNEKKVFVKYFLSEKKKKQTGDK